MSHDQSLFTDGTDEGGKKAEGVRVTCEARESFPAFLLYRFDEVGSTNDIAKEFAQQGAAEGTAIVADSQTAGRGRLQRRWTSPKGKGIYLSVILRPAMPVTRAPQLTMLTAVAVAQAIRRITGLEARTKWPNDVVIGEKKVCGILTEVSAQGMNLNFAVIGIGVNVLMTPDDLPFEVRKEVTSLAMEWRQPVEREQVLHGILQALAEYYHRYRTEPFRVILDEYKSLDIALGNTVRVIDERTQIVGVVEDIDEFGTLTLRLPDGRWQPVLTGKVSLRRSQ
ncbi:MAG: biotin--[acetyl-CoA-carboxylase] ligase [Abditibacteriales bacterium]|nr:biotin--[acetyl-CoA-carboxylase] ligase [Abditibacteriales bacterium]MDW8366918.1 biotin--[acetyl-CoA-carboxylase] ligase [Abditibacteriales bacterium]